MDYYSRFIEIARLNSRGGSYSHKEYFHSTWHPRNCRIGQWSPVYLGEFSKTYQFKHVTSSPYYPQSNGEAERAVKTIKGMLKKCEDPYLALLSYRSTPLPIGYSPSQLLMDCTLRSSIPTTRGQRVPSVPDPDTVRANDAKVKTRPKENYDSHHGAKVLPSLLPGVSVWVPDRQTEATVDQEVAPQSFEVSTSDGTYRRNRRDLIPLPDPPDSPNNSSNRTEPNTATTAESNKPRRSNRASRPPDRLNPSWIHNRHWFTLCWTQVSIGEM